jgi:hypothetical protein
MVLRSLSFAMLAVLLMSLGSSMCGAQAPPVQDTKTDSPTNGQAPGPQSPTAGPSSADASKQAQQALNAVDKAAPAVSKASDAVSKADRYTKAIQDITGTTTRSTQPVTGNLQTLQATIEAIQHNNVVDTLNAALKEIDATQSDNLEAAVKDACNKLKQPASGNQQDVTDVLAKCAASQKDAATTLATVTPALTALQKAMQSISPYLATQFHSLADKLSPFVDAKLISSDLNGTSSAAVLLQVLPKGMPALQQVVSTMGEYKSAWSSMKPTLSANAGTASTTADKKDDSSSKADPLDPNTEFKKLQDSVDAIESKLAGWLGIIATQLNTDSQMLDGKLSGVASDPAKTSAEALGLVRDESATLATAQTIVDNWPPLVGFLVDGQPAGFSVATARKSREDLQKASNTLRVSISRLQDAVAGDFTDFETDQVSLYYFSDIPRLMYALNNGFQTMGGVAEAKAQADAQRTALTLANCALLLPWH